MCLPLWRRTISFVQSLRGRQSIAYALCFAVLGIVIASAGPALVVLQKHGQDLSALAFLFTTRSAAYLIGSVIGGPLFDRLPGHLVLAISLSIAAVGTALIPISYQTWLTMLAVATQGFAMGIVDTGGNLLLIWIHGSHVGPHIQSAHFAFGIGAVVAPLIFHGFHSSEVKWAFWTMSFCFIPIIIWLFILQSPSRPPKAESAQEPSQLSRFRRFCRMPFTKLELGIVAAGGALLLFYVGVEVAYGGFITTLAVNYLGMTEKNAELLTFVFWVSLTTGRFLAIGASIFISPEVMQLTALIGAALSLIPLVSYNQGVTLTWIFTGFFGFFLASVFPTTLTLAEKYMKMTGISTTVIIFGASLGEMLIPLTVGSLFAVKPPLYYAIYWVSLVGMVLGMASFIAMYLFGRANRSSRIQATESLKETEIDLEARKGSLSSLSATQQGESPESDQAVKEDNEQGKTLATTP